MSNKKQITVTLTVTRDELIDSRNPQGNEMLASATILSRLRAQGVPVIGILGVLAVENGTLTIKHEDGLDGDEWTWTWTGEPMADKWVRECARPGAALKLNYPLAKMIADAEEL